MYISLYMIKYDHILYVYTFTELDISYIRYIRKSSYTCM
jgi:hypothetical protein